MIQYLEDPADWLIEHKHPVATFINRINSYEVKAPPERPTSRIRNCPQCHAKSGSMTIPARTATGRERHGNQERSRSAVL